MNSYNLFNIPFSTLTQMQTTEHVISLSRAEKASSVILCNAHVVVESEWDPSLKDLLNEASLIIPDGAPIKWLLRAKKQKQAQRYSGIDLMGNIFRSDPQGKHFFLGSTPEVLSKIKEKFGGLAVGFYSPPFAKSFSHEEIQKQLSMIEESGADYIWIGLGAPKQERYVVEMSRQAKRGVWLAVGAAFDFYTGLKPRAPVLLQNLGLEWAFRMLSEPRRLTKRYITTNPVFIKLAVSELFKR